MLAVSRRSFAPQGMPWSGPLIVAGGDGFVGGAGLFEGVIAGEGDDAAEFGIEAGDAVEIDFGEALGGEVAVLDPAGELMDGGEGDGGIVGGERDVCNFGANKLIAEGEGGRAAGVDGIGDGVGDDGGWERDLAGAGAALVEGSHGGAPVAGGELAVGLGHGDLNEAAGLEEGDLGDVGADSGRGAEGGRHAGGHVSSGRGRGSGGRGGGWR